MLFLLCVFKSVFGLILSWRSPHNKENRTFERGHLKATDNIIFKAKMTNLCWHFNNVPLTTLSLFLPFFFLLLMSCGVFKWPDRNKQGEIKKKKNRNLLNRAVTFPRSPFCSILWGRDDGAQSVSGKLNWQEIHPLMKRTKELITAYLKCRPKWFKKYRKEAAHRPSPASFLSFC